MTTAIIMDGPGIGHTEQEWDEIRKRDGEIAIYFGFSPFDDQQQLWLRPGEEHGVGIDGVYRDEPAGVPLFSTRVDHAWLLIEHVCKEWRYSARQVFFNNLQERASFDGAGTVAWPDCIVSLVDEFPLHVALAFLKTINWAKEVDFDLVESARSRKWADKNVSTFTQTVTDDDGNERTVKGAVVTGKPPWVHDEA